MRKTTRVQIPAPVGAVILNPSSVVLAWSGYRRSFDIGAISYPERDLVQKRRRLTGPVWTDRDHFIRRYIQVLSEMSEVDEHRPSTQMTLCQHLALFIDWVDNRQYSIELHNPESVEPLAREYIAALNVQVKLGALNHNTAAAKAKNIKTIFRRVFGLEEWGGSLPILRGSHRATNSTPVPPPQLQARAYALARVVFEGVADFLASGAPFPIALSGPFGNEGAIQSIYLMADGRSSLRPGRFWDARTGIALDRGAIRKLFEGERWANQNVFRTITQIDALVRESESSNSRIRRELGFLASYCFAYLFMAQSGLNLQQIIEFENPASLAVLMNSADVSSQGKRLLKWRAGGRPIYAEFPIGFLSSIEKFLGLRSFLVGVETIDSLLIGQKKEGGAGAISETFLTQLRSWLETLGISFPNIKSRKTRVAMQDFLIRTETPEVTAKIMNHSEETTRKKYSNGSSESQVEEMGSFFERFEATLTNGGRAANEVDSSVGSCSSYRNPIPVHPEVPVMPNCTSSEGCLFCANLRVHSDEIDLRKLLSCRRCLELTGEANAIDIRNDPVFDVVTKRLDFLIGELRTVMDAGVFSRVLEEVERFGMLDQFWEEKLNQLMELGIV